VQLYAKEVAKGFLTDVNFFMNIYNFSTCRNIFSNWYWNN